MKISVIGLGKLGYPMAEFLSSSGLSINCYDKNEKLLVDLKNKVNPLKFENELFNYINNDNNLNYFLNIQDCLKGTDICFVTVPTPSNIDGSFNNKYLEEVLENLSIYILDRKKNKLQNPLIINVNSTVSPGTFENILIPYLEKKGLKNNEEFVFLYNPYFVALGDVVKGLKNPDMVLIGCENHFAKKNITNLYKMIYTDHNFKFLNFKEAELTKLLLNTYLTLKISFSNMVRDISQISKDVNPLKILKTIGSDSRVGLKYFMPGGPFSGPCLPRDNQALLNYCEKILYKNHVSKGVLETNSETTNELKKQIKHLKTIGIDSLGFAGIGYKSNTPSLEESFSLELISFASSIGIKVYYSDIYINHKIDNATRVSDILGLCELTKVIFLPYSDKRFNQFQNMNNIIVWDIWFQIEGNNVVRSLEEINNLDKNINKKVIKLKSF